MKLFKNNYHKRHFFLMFQMILVSFMGFYQTAMADGNQGVGTGTSEGEDKLLAAIKKQNDEQLGALKLFVNQEVEKMKGLINNDMSGDELRKLTSQVAKSCQEIEQKYGDMENLAQNKEIRAEFEKMNEVLEKQGLEISKLRTTKKQVKQSNTLTKDSYVKQLISKFVESDAFAEYSKYMKGHSPRYTLNKDGDLVAVDELTNEDRIEASKTVSITTDHTGDVLISDPRLNIRDFPLRSMNVRDLIPQSTAQSSQIVGPEVYDYTDVVNGGMQMLSENGEAQDIGFKTRENSWGVKRIAASLPMSKRWLKENGLNWIVNYLAQRLPKFVRVKEDFQILFGDGSGQNVDGLTKDAQSFNLIRGTYTAGAFASVATWESGAKSLITFAAAHGLRNGDNLTIANATEATYNATHKSIIVKSQTEVIINLAYVVEADTSLWTGSGTSKWYQSIDGAQLYDVLVVAKSEMQTAEYEVTGYVLNDADLDGIGLIKATDLQYVGVARDAFGRANINGLPIVTTNAMPAGQYLVGDFQMAVEIADYTPLQIYATEDTTDAKKNQITWIIEEEFILAKYNPFWFMYGYASEAITQLKTP